MKGNTSQRRLVLTGCAAALITGLLSSLALMIVALAPSLGGTVPAAAEPGPGQPDVTVVVEEAYLNEELTRSFSTRVPGSVTVDVQPGSRLVAGAVFDLALTQLQMVTELALSAANGDLQVTVLSVEVSGPGLTGLVNLIGMSESTLGQSMGEAIDEGIGERLGQEADILDVSTNETQLMVRLRVGRAME